MGWGAAIGAGIGLIGSVLGSKSKKDAAEKSGDVALSQAELEDERQREFFEYQKGVHAPYQAIGLQGLKGLSEGLPRAKSEKYRGMYEGLGTAKSDKYRDLYEGLGMERSGQYARDLDVLKTDIPKFGGLDKFQYKVDIHDPAYRFRKDEMTRALQQSAAARGQFNSRAAMNALMRGNLRLSAEEADRQFGRQKEMYGMESKRRLTEHAAAQQEARERLSRTSGLYDLFTQREAREAAKAKDLYGMALGEEASRAARVRDLYGMALGEEATRYNWLADLAKLGQGAAGAIGQATGQAAGTSAGIYSALSSQLQQSQLAQGQAQAGMWEGLGSTGLNVLGMYMGGGKGGGAGTSKIMGGGAGMWT